MNNITTAMTSVPKPDQALIEAFRIAPTSIISDNLARLNGWERVDVCNAFVGTPTPLQDDRVPKSLVAIQDQQRREMPWQKFLMTVGWYRLHGDCDSVAPGFEAYAAIIRANNCAPSQFDALEAELDAERQSGEETVHTGPFPRLPILIFSRDPASMPSNWPPDVAKANSVVWNQMQEESKRLSPLSRRVIAKGSDHYVHVDRPDLVISEVTALIESFRRGEVSYRQEQPTVTK